MNLRIIIVVQRCLGHIETVRKRAAAHGSGAPVHIHIKRRGHIAHNGEGLLNHLVKGIRVIAVGNRDRGAENTVVIAIAVDKAFVVLLGHSSAPEGHLVHVVRDGIEPIHRLLRTILPIRNQVNAVHALRGGYSRKL